MLPLLPILSPGFLQKSLKLGNFSVVLNELPCVMALLDDNERDTGLVLGLKLDTGFANGSKFVG